jgi:hypothetical protein
MSGLADESIFVLAEGKVPETEEGEGEVEEEEEEEGDRFEEDAFESDNDGVLEMAAPLGASRSGEGFLRGDTFEFSDGLGNWDAVEEVSGAGKD